MQTYSTVHTVLDKDIDHEFNSLLPVYFEAKKKKKKFRVATKSAGLDSARTPAAARCCIRAQAPIQLKMIVHNDICSKIKVVWILKISTGLHNELKQALHLFHAFLVKNATCGYYHRPYMP